MKEQRALSFAEVSAALERAASPMGAAGGHGFLTGLLCVMPAASRDQWQAELLADAEPGDLLAADCGELLEDLAVATRGRLASPELGFSPLLPAEARPLAERARALAEWCDGFLYGIGFAGYDTAAARSEEEREFVADLGEITRLEPGAGGEEDERALAELIEYVRVGVLLVSRVPEDAPRGEDDTLH